MVEDGGFKGVLLTFGSVVMYGHFDGIRAAWYRQVVKIKPKFPVFRSEVQNGVM